MAKDNGQPKQRSNSAYVFAVVDGKLTWDYPGIGKLTFDPDKASATNRARAMMYGWKQRINDAAALEAGADGKVDPKAKFEEQRRLIEHLETGSEDWNLKATGDRGTTSYVTQALVLLGKYQGHDTSTTDLANAFVKKVAELPALKLKGEMGPARKWLEANSKQIREAIEMVRASEKPAVDADDELAKLLGTPKDEEAKAAEELEQANYAEMYRQGLVSVEEAQEKGVDTAAIDAEVAAGGAGEEEQQANPAG